jgi:hypothetical protein
MTDRLLYPLEDNELVLVIEGGLVAKAAFLELGQRPFFTDLGADLLTRLDEVESVYGVHLVCSEAYATSDSADVREVCICLVVDCDSWLKLDVHPTEESDQVIIDAFAEAVT